MRPSAGGQPSVSKLFSVMTRDEFASVMDTDTLKNREDTSREKMMYIVKARAGQAS